MPKEKAPQEKAQEKAPHLANVMAMAEEVC